MSITNTQLFKDSLVLAGVLTEVENPSAEQGDSALRALNEMLAEWFQDGIELGFWPQTSQSATCPIPDHAVSAIKFNLALRFAGEYAIAVTPEVAKLASDKLARLERATIDYELADMSHLPGSIRNAYNINNA